MSTMVLCFAVLGQVARTKAILDETSERLKQINALSMVVERTTEEFPRLRRTECVYRRGGYSKEGDGPMVRVADPKEAWAYSAIEKSYQALPVASKESSATPWMRWFDLFVAELPIMEGPTNVTWHGLHALRIELDGRKAMTKETKLFIYLTPKTHLPLGISANLGSITQVVVFKGMKLDPKLDDDLFVFVPPVGWKRLKG